LYKFGKIASMPDWKDKGKSDSFMNIVKDNQSIKAHSLILCDIGLSLDRTLKQLEEVARNKHVDLDKIIVCSRMGIEDQEQIFYDTLDKLKKQKVGMPFCLIIPSEMHFMEKEALEAFTN